MTDLSGKTILIAGSARGIGAAAARIAHAEGATVILHGRTASRQLASLAEELGGAATISCDGRDAAAVSAAIESALANGPIDSLICTLGAVQQSDALDGDTEIWLEEFRANVLAPVNF